MRLPPSKRAWAVAGSALGCGVLIAAAAAMTLSSQQRTDRIALAVTGGNPARAADNFRRYGCGGCHTIPGIPGADGQVGPALSGLIHRVYVGGVALNSADNLVQWIVAPQKLSPRSAMPATGISEAEARDIVAYLYQH